MRQFISFVIREAKHILRDKRTMLILFGMPVVLMLLFGFAITNDVKNVRTVVVTSQMDHLTRAAVERLAASEYFTIVSPHAKRCGMADSQSEGRPCRCLCTGFRLKEEWCAVYRRWQRPQYGTTMDGLCPTSNCQFSSQRHTPLRRRIINCQFKTTL